MRRAAAVVAAVVVAAVGLACLVIIVPVFSVKEVSVEGNVQEPEDAIVETSGISVGENMVRVDTQAAAARVAGREWVNLATVSKKWPGEIVIQIEERVAVLHAGDELIDAEGQSFHANDIPETALEATGAGAADAEVARAAGALDPEILATMQRVDAPSPQEITFFTNDGREIYWGSGELAQDKSRATAIVLSREGQRWDVSNPYLVTVREGHNGDHTTLK